LRGGQIAFRRSAIDAAFSLPLRPFEIFAASSALLNNSLAIIRRGDRTGVLDDQGRFLIHPKAAASAAS
jgi:hypothetical protein